jgi:hypothetical protein
MLGVHTSLERTAGGRSGGGKGWFAAAQLCRSTARLSVGRYLTVAYEYPVLKYREIQKQAEDLMVRQAIASHGACK